MLPKLQYSFILFLPTSFDHCLWLTVLGHFHWILKHCDVRRLLEDFFMKYAPNPELHYHSSRPPRVYLLFRQKSE